MAGADYKPSDVSRNPTAHKQILVLEDSLCSEIVDSNMGVYSNSVIDKKTFAHGPSG